MPEGAVLSPLYNTVVRALVREGETKAAVSMLESMARSDGSIVATSATVRPEAWFCRKMRESPVDEACFS